MRGNILELIKQSPVEWKALGSVVKTITAPSKLKKEDYKEVGRLPIIDQGEKYIAGYTNKDLKPIPKNEYIIFGDHSEHIKYVNFEFTQGADGIKILKPYSDHVKYIYYAFQNLYRKKLSYKRHWSIAKETLIPIPPLEIQTEIVRILDAFTALTAELTAELSIRQQQYNYYRDLLLSESELQKVGFEWKTLGEITLPTSNIRWRETDKCFRYIDLSSVSRENNSIIETAEISAENAPSRAQKIVNENDVIFATTRPTLQRFALINNEFSGEIASTGFCVLRAMKTEVLPKWIFYNISSARFNNYVEEHQSGAAYPAIPDSKVKEFKIPIPPFTEQARIVAILDKFDALTSSITEGLPREIKLRQQQYEYYRDLLLSFPKAVPDKSAIKPSL